MATQRVNGSAQPGGYFDANATTPLCPAARDAWLGVADLHWHNPSSLYPAAAAARDRLEDARWRLADLIGGEPESLVFTSGATEANNGLFRELSRWLASGDRIAISGLEHPAVSLPARAWFGARVDPLPIDAGGRIDLEAVRARLASPQKPRLVSVMAANNETGVLQPWREIARVCREHGVLYHCDASQWLGKMPAEGLAECDFLTGSGHKVSGPHGVGFLKLPDPEDDSAPDWRPVFQHGGNQEGERRGGTEDVAAVCAMVTALEQRDALVCDGDWRDRRAAWRDAFEQRVTDRIDGAAVIGGARHPRLWNTSMLALPGPRNVKWLTRLARRGFEVSTGSACSAGAGKPSAVLASMGIAPEMMGRVLRFSSLWETGEADWQVLAEAVGEVGGEELESAGDGR